MNNTFLTADLRKKLSAQVDEVCRIVASENKLHNTDLNNVIEDIFKEALNLGLSLNLVNLNAGSKQEAGIDLGDKEARICYQITAESSSTKIHECLDAFQKNEWYKDYDQLHIFFANDYMTTLDKLSKKLEEKTYDFDYTKVVTITNKNELKTAIFNTDIDRLGKVVDYLDKELSPTVNNPQRSVGVVNDIISHCVSSMEGSKIETKTAQDLPLHTTEKIILNFEDPAEADAVVRYIRNSLVYSSDINEAINLFPNLDSSDLEGYMMHVYGRLSQNDDPPMKVLLDMFDFFVPADRQADYSYFSWARRFVCKYFENCTIFKRTKNEMQQVSLI